MLTACNIPDEVWKLVLGFAVIYLTAKLLNCAISLVILLLAILSSLLLGWLAGMFLPDLAAGIIALIFFIVILKITAKIKQFISWLIIVGLFATLLVSILY